MKKFHKVFALILALVMVLSMSLTAFAAEEIPSGEIRLPAVREREENKEPSEEPGEEPGETPAEEPGEEPGEAPAEEPAEEQPEETPAAPEETTEEPEEAPEAEQPAGIPMREGPDGLSVIVDELPADAEYTILGYEGDWVKIQIGDKIAYVYGPDIGIFPEHTEGEPVEKKVTIFANRTLSVAPGDTIKLTSRLEGFEDCEYVLFQWECNKGAGWEEVPGATSDTYSFTFSEETNHTAWRLRVISE